MSPAIKICKLSGPCKGCEDRFVGCHSQCEKYREFRNKCDEQLEIKNKQKALEYDLTSYIISAKERCKRNSLHRPMLGRERRHRK